MTRENDKKRSSLQCYAKPQPTNKPISHSVPCSWTNWLSKAVAGPAISFLSAFTEDHRYLAMYDAIIPKDVIKVSYIAKRDDKAIITDSINVNPAGRRLEMKPFPVNIWPVPCSCVGLSHTERGQLFYWQVFALTGQKTQQLLGRKSTRTWKTRLLEEK